MNTIIFYHDDLDGLVSALGYAYNDYTKNHSDMPDYKKLKEEYFFYEVNYGIKNIFYNLKYQKIDLNSFKTVIILDYCFHRKTMIKFLEQFKQNMIWIDHHKNIMTEFSDLEINGLRDINNSAAVLVWKYFNKDAPLFSQYIEDMDIWLWQLPDSRDILHYIDHLYMDISNKEKHNEIMNVFLKLFDNTTFKKNMEKYKEFGKIIDDYLKTKVIDDISTGKKLIFEGINTFIVNSQIKPGYVSEKIFNSEEFRDVELVIIWYRSYLSGITEKHFDKISLRSKNIDCSIIAKKYGGNGHPKASGFVIDDISNLNEKI